MSTTPPGYAAHIATLDARWHAAVEASAFDAAIIGSGAQRLYFLDDQAPPFRANPHFAQYLPGADVPDCFLLVTPGQPTRIYFHQPTDYWHAPPTPPTWAEGALTLEVFESLEALEEKLAADCGPLGRVASIGPDAVLNMDPADANPPALINPIHFHRAEKTAFEVDAIAGASAAAARGHLAAAEAFHAGASEFEINSAYLLASAQVATELPYPNIVALNEHAGFLHYQHYERERPQVTHSFLIDAGARHCGYAADVTRTYAAADSPLASAFTALDRADGCRAARDRGRGTGRHHLS